MSWTGHEAGVLPWLALVLAGAFFLLGLGPFSHLALTRRLWPRLKEELGGGAGREELLAFRAGSLAPDAGYFPGGPDPLSFLVHIDRPWDFCRALLEEARTPLERAFALGWLSHALLDITGHGGVVNRLADSTYQTDPLAHKRVEWGLECNLLSRPDMLWLYQPLADFSPCLDLWGRALRRTYGAAPGPEVLLRASLGTLATMRRLTWIFWLTGQSRKHGAVPGNALGAGLGRAARRIILARTDPGDLDRRGVLDTIAPNDRAVDLWEESLFRAGELWGKALEGGALPDLNLDADPESGVSSASAREAREWLEGLRAPVGNRGV